MKRWIQDEAKTYFEKTKAARFKLHNFRGTAMSKARLAGVPEDDAAVAFDCTPETMRQHCLAFDKTKVADRVFERMRLSGAVSGAVSGTAGAASGANGNGQNDNAADQPATKGEATASAASGANET